MREVYRRFTQPSKCRIILYLCAEWEAEKGGRMGCLMKEKIQGLAERKAFNLLFLIVWELCSSSGNLTYQEIIARPAFLVNLHTAMVCMVPPPLFPHLPRIFAPTSCGSTPSPIGWEKIRFHEFNNRVGQKF